MSPSASEAPKVIPHPLLEGWSNDANEVSPDMPDISAIVAWLGELEDTNGLSEIPEWRQLILAWIVDDDAVKEATARRDEKRTQIEAILKLRKMDPYKDELVSINFASSARYNWTRFRKDHPDLDFDEYKNEPEPSMRMTRKGGGKS